MKTISSCHLGLLRLTVVLLALTGVASASSLINATGVDWTRGESIWIDENGSTVNAYFAGVIFIALTQNGQQYNRDTLCVDLFTDIYLGQTYGTQLLNPSDVPGRNLERVAWLIDNALLPTQNQQVTSALSPSDWVTTAAQGAGIQLAIWDITTDGGDGLSSGSVQASTSPGAVTDPAVVAWANIYETLSLNEQSNSAFVYQNWNLNNLAPAQMLEGPMFQDNGPAPVPEPLTYVLVGGALVGLGIFRRRQGLR
jgi:hypothetical protein